ncbi:hypothetical protein KJ632_03925 [Patescibacteria group bacterium]|nr:hypothetical protein [Patescibacteria group bacterium]
MSGKYNFGVVGYCPPSHFDEDEAKIMINKGFDQISTNHPDAEINIVSGLTNVGVLAIAYEEAQKRGWKTSGIACKKAEEYPLFPVDDKKIVGENWGDESQTFINSIDGILRVGGGPQSKQEVRLVREKGGEVIEFELALITEETREKISDL